MTRPGRRRVRRLGLLAASGLALVLLSGFVVAAIDESLQMDFAAFYTAGEALNHGDSPYTNGTDREPPVWDGIAPYRHSRFLYPPLAAALFQPLARLPYQVSKTAWTLLGLCAIAVSVWLVNRLFMLHRAPGPMLGFLACVGLYAPLYAHVERGQIDGLTLLLLTAASAGFRSRQASTRMGAGALVAVATLFKLQCIYVLPFMIWRRLWWPVAGATAGAAALLAVSLAVVGPAAVNDYATNELFRIAAFGEEGTPDMAVAPERLRELRGDAPAGWTRKDGRLYREDLYPFAVNATAARYVVDLAAALLPRFAATGAVSAALLLGFFVVTLFAEPATRAGAAPWTDRQHFYYWQIVLVIVLLSGPLTWIMNLVWLLPLGLAVMADVTIGAEKGRRYLLLLAVGLLATGLPDLSRLPLVGPALPRLVHGQYVAALGAVLVGVIGYWRASFSSFPGAGRPAAA